MSKLLYSPFSNLGTLHIERAETNLIAARRSHWFRHLIEHSVAGDAKEGWLGVILARLTARYLGEYVFNGQPQCAGDTQD